MQSKVNILADDMGNVIRQSANNSEYGYIRLQQNKVTFGNNGWVKKANVSTLLLGKLEDLQSLDFKVGDQMGGKIVIKEQLEPFNIKDGDRDLKMAGQTGIVCCVDGQPIYRKTFYVADATAQDVLLSHTNGQDIKDANAASAPEAVKINNATTLEAFGLNDDEEGNTEEVVDEVEGEEIEEEVEETFEL
jgi:hypothetical protein